VNLSSTRRSITPRRFRRGGDWLRPDGPAVPRLILRVDAISSIEFLLELMERVIADLVVARISRMIGEREPT
jgi:hypothetical protein